jgi:guanylate kinase
MIIENELGTEYTQHSIFEQSKFYSNFYDLLTFSIMHFISMGTKSFLNIDTYVYSSIKGTIE